MADPLTLTKIVTECALPGFYAGILGNLAASGIQWAVMKGHGRLKDILLKGTDSALKNHDLVRALVRAQLEAATQVIDITLLEDYSAETTATRNWITHLSYLFPSKALRDQSNDHIKCLWDLRARLEDRVKELNKLTATELDRNLVVAITNAQSIAAPDLSAGAEGPYAEWSDAAAYAMCDVLTNLAAPSDIPETLHSRILNGEWTDLFRVAFREELKRDENAETAYFINVHDTLATYANQHVRELGDLKIALKQGYDRQDGKLGELRNLLFSLRSHVKNLESASDAERRQITAALTAQQIYWRKLVDEQQQHWQQAHTAHTAILKGQAKEAKEAAQRNKAQLAEHEKTQQGILKLEEAQLMAAQSSRFDALTSNIIRHLKREFWGRRWLFEQIAEFRRKNHATGGFVVITGLPGQGKSAIAAHLADEASSLVHLFRRGTVFSDLNSFHAHVLEQAAAQFQVVSDGRKKGRSPTELLESLFWEISGQLTFPSDCLVVIDGLDEAAPEALRSGDNPLGLPKKLGRGIFVVITSRERNDCKLVDFGETPVLPIELHRSSDSSNDAIDYIQHHLAEPKVRGYMSRNNLSADEFARTLMAKSEGNFMYLRHVLPELADGILVGTKLDHFPKGLREYYALHWQAMVNDAQGSDLGWKMAVLAVLASLQEQCGSVVICEIVHRIPGVLGSLHPDKTIQNKVHSSTIEDVRALLGEWQEFLLTDYAPEHEPESRIYHLEFSEFLRENALRSPIDFVRVTAKAFFEWQRAKRDTAPK
jgi:DNA replication protein DnaC